MELMEKLDAILEAYEPTEEDAAELAEQKKVRKDFIAAFPKDRLADLNLETYCIGRGNKENLCWWVERGTKIISKYFPGSSKSYGVFWSKGTNDYRFYAGARAYHDQNPKADAEKVLREAIVKPLVKFVEDHGSSAKAMQTVVGPGFLLKLLMLYYPDEFIQINSTAWIGTIIEKLGLKKSDTFVEDNKTVKRLYDEKRKLVKGGDLTQGALVSILVDLLGLKKEQGVQYWHMQLHPGSDNKLSREDVLRLITKYSVVGMGSGWENDGGQPEMFKSGVREGDVIGIREGGFVALVRVTGPCRKNEKEDDLCWFDIVRPVELLSDEAEKYMALYREKTQKGPHDNLYNPATLSPIKPQCKNKFLKFWYESVMNVEPIDGEDEEAYETTSEDVGYHTYSKEEFLSEVFMTSEQYDELYALLMKKRNVILTGAPGVGKTFAAKRLAWSVMGEKDAERIQFVQFHQSYSYEDFICGYKPCESGFHLEAGVFYRFCQKAREDGERPYFFIIDEINRGNLSKIFGELLMLIEADKRGNDDYGVRLAYKPDELFVVPKNVYIIGMMNTADRSLAIMDYALRRRFSFFPMKPGFETDGFANAVTGNAKLQKLAEAVRALNDRIAADPALGDGYVIGHSYFCANGADAEEIVKFDLAPTLKEYWFDDTGKAEGEIKTLLESAK